MDYCEKEVDALNLLSAENKYSKQFNTPKDLLYFVIFISVCIGIAVVYACLTTVDKVIPAMGELNTNSKLFYVKNKSNGSVSNLHIKEGNRVEEGDLLVSFDVINEEYRLEQLKKEFDSNCFEIWKNYYQLKNSLESSELNKIYESILVYPDNVVDSTIFSYLNDGFDSFKHMNNLEILGKIESIQIEESNMEVVRMELESINNKLEYLKVRFDKKMITKEVYENQIIKKKEYEKDLKNSGSRIIKFNYDIDKLTKELKNYIGEYTLIRLEGIKSLVKENEKIIIEMEKVQNEIKDKIIRSPVSGVIDNVFISGKNENILSYSDLFSIRPDYSEDEFKLEIDLPTNFALWVRVGMEFKATAIGGNLDEYGSVEGMVEFISKSSFEKNGGSYYRVVAKINKINSVDSNSRIALMRPGNQFSVNIKVGTRKLINYIFDPFSEGFKNAFSEP